MGEGENDPVAVFFHLLPARVGYPPVGHRGGKDRGIGRQRGLHGLKHLSRGLDPDHIYPFGRRHAGGPGDKADPRAQIAGATEENKVGILEISKSITEINTLAQNNAATTEQISASSEELAGTAENIKAKIHDFKV